MAKEQFSPTLPADQGFKLSEFLPTGKAWDAKTDETTNLGKLLLAFGGEFNRIEALIELTNKELDINFAQELIREWELSVGIPDDCFSIDGTFDERHTQIIAKLRNVRLQTIQDYIDLAALFGIFVVVTPGVPEGTPATDKEKRFSITINLPGQFSGEIFPFPNFFPIPFTAKITSLVQCLFEKLKPANVQMIIQYGQFPLIIGTFEGDVNQLIGIMLGTNIEFFGTLNGDVGQLSGIIITAFQVSGPLDGVIDQLIGNIQGGGIAFIGTLNGDIGQLSGTIIGNVEAEGTLVGDIGQLSGAILGSGVPFVGDLVGVIDQLTGTITGLLVPEGTLVGDIGQLSGSIAGDVVGFIGTLEGDIGQLSGTINGVSVEFFGTLNGDIGQLSGVLSGLLSDINWDDLDGNWDDLSGNWDDL